MIDKNGRKIEADEGDYDKEFAAKEIKFFMKGFRMEADDTKAFSIAKMIRAYVKNNGSFDDIIEYLEELEEYAPITQSEDFLWQLVYIRRHHEAVFKDYKNLNYKTAFEVRYIGAGHFEHICRVCPSAFNKRVRVSEYLNAACDLTGVAGFVTVSSKLIEVCNYAESLFEEAVPDAKGFYYDTGRLLYYLKYYYCRHRMIEDREGEKENLRKAISYVVKACEADKTETFYIDRLLYLYGLAMDLRAFFCNEDIKNLDDLCKWSSDNYNSGIDKFNDYYNKLDSLRNKVISKIKV